MSMSSRGAYLVDPSGLAMSLVAIAPNPFPGMGRISSLQLDMGLYLSGAEAAHKFGFKRYNPLG